MKLAHNIEIRVFCKEQNNEEDIMKALKSLVPLDFDKDNFEFSCNNAELFEARKMKIYSVFIKKEKQTTKFLKNLFKALSDEQKELLYRQMDSRLDEKLHFYIRLDKQKLLDGEYVITDSGDCFHINICVAAYPHKREVAMAALEKMLEW
ncbi:MAG: hypothetical protein KKF44_02575 [Nanoarchaeota archaeon]|nr:hypothetical protein [Nanoarchaeota archaeon]